MKTALPFPFTRLFGAQYRTTPYPTEPSSIPCTEGEKSSTMPRCEDCRGVGGQNCQGDLILCRRCVDRRRLPSANKEPATFTKPKDVAESSPNPIQGSCHQEVNSATVPAIEDEVGRNVSGECGDRRHDVTRNLSRFTGTINKIVAGTSNPQSSSCTPQDSREVVQLVDEYIEREKRRKNLVVFNVPEDVKDDATDSMLSDKKLFIDITKEEFNLIPKVQAAYRLGRKTSDKPRPLLIRMDNDDTSSRALILRRAKDLRNSTRWSRVYIVPDMTPNEREADRKLRQELKSRKEAGEANLVIRRGRIVCTQTPREPQPRDGRDDHSQA
ncbi:hypothetical protein Bbelb_080760 [Branchiostoma belcheri]|nr:hypothetical protein Bbelb_080760 [Branchiostoma belcheri]